MTQQGTSTSGQAATPGHMQSNTNPMAGHSLLATADPALQARLLALQRQTGGGMVCVHAF